MTAVNIHNLSGCTPDSLASYLKGLGVLRLVAEQLDPRVRGWWANEYFVLATASDRAEVMGFFLRDYIPTPIMAPWNGGSGFYPRDNHRGIQAIYDSRAARWAPYRDALREARTLVQDRPTSPKEEEKALMIGKARHNWRGGAKQWLDTAVVLSEHASPAYPALLGTGGNDGRLDFTNNFMQRLAELFDMASPTGEPRPEAEPQLALSLWELPGPRTLVRGAVGQFAPGGAGGANSTCGFQRDGAVNPWDFVLVLEGAICFTSALNRRLRLNELPQAAAPFAVRSSAVGFGTAAFSEESSRGEQWTPLWHRPASWPEVKALLGEGRCSIGRTPVRRPVEVARAIARLGVARGIDGFQRFGFLERHGQNNLAVPLGRWKVTRQPHSLLADQAAEWVDRLATAANTRGAPNSWRLAAQRCEQALVDCCREGRDRSRWQGLLIAMGNAEGALGRRPRNAAKVRLRPLGPLSPEWVTVLPDSPECRLALAFADQYGTNPQGQIEWIDHIRGHFVPLGSPFAFNDRISPHVVARSGHLQRDAAAILRRRSHMNAPLRSGHRLAANLADIAAFLRGELDEGLILELARPLMALTLAQVRPSPGVKLRGDDLGSLAVYGVLRLATWPGFVKLEQGEVMVRHDPELLVELASGNLASAFAVAWRRLRASGLRPFFKQAVADAAVGRRVAAALLFPIDDWAAGLLVERLTYPTLQNE